MQTFRTNLKTRLSLAGTALALFLVSLIVQIIIGVIPIFNFVIFAAQAYFGLLWYHTPKEFKFKGPQLVNFFYLVSALLADIVIALAYLGLIKGIIDAISRLFQ